MVTAKSKTLKNTWITKGILKFSKRKQRVSDKFLKSKTYEHEIVIKTTVSYLNRLKKEPSRDITQTWHFIVKKSWEIMKEVIWKGKLLNNLLLKHLISNNRNIFDQKPLPIASINIFSMLD